MVKKRLDFLIIPNAQGDSLKEKKKIAEQEKHKREIDNILIIKGKDSEEDILYLSKLIKKSDRIGFVTFPLHFKEYKQIIKKAQKQKEFPKKVKLECIKIKQNLKRRIYGFLGLEEEKLKHRKLDYKKNRKEKFLDLIKSFVKKTLNFIFER